MGLVLISHRSEEHEGYGAEEGSIDTYEYVCPCGKGKVIYTKDNIPGFRDKDITIECEECRKKYGYVKSMSELV